MLYPRIHLKCLRQSQWEMFRKLARECGWVQSVFLYHTVAFFLPAIPVEDLLKELTNDLENKDLFYLRASEVAK